MDQIELGGDWYIGNEPEIDFTELNKSHVITRYTNTVKILNKIRLITTLMPMM